MNCPICNDKIVIDYKQSDDVFHCNNLMCRFEIRVNMFLECYYIIDYIIDFLSETTRKKEINIL